MPSRPKGVTPSDANDLFNECYRDVELAEPIEAEQPDKRHWWNRP